MSDVLGFLFSVNCNHYKPNYRTISSLLQSCCKTFYG